MGLFDHFPYTNFHELNLTWILNALKEIQTTMDQFVAINALKYADPIQWNIVRQYEKNTIVIDPLTGTAYISVQPVPSGVIITNTDYWSVVFDLGSFVVRAAKNFTNRWESQWTQTATFPSNTGNWLVWNDTLYEVISNIIAGDQYVINSNIRHITMEEIVNNIYTHYNSVIGDLDDLTTVDKSNIVAAINEIVNNIGDLDNLLTTDKSSIINAINENTTDINNIKTRFLRDDIYNVRMYGALGDGNNDDTQAFKDAITAASGAIVYVPNGQYVITDTLSIKGLLFMSENATLIAGADVDILRLKPDGVITGGRIDVTYAGYSHSAVIALGEDKFTSSNYSHFNSIERLAIRGSYGGNGIYLHANLQADSKSWVQNIRVFNCTIERMNNGIYCHADTAPDTDHATWCNANIFDNIWLAGCVYGIKTEGSGIPNEAAGNSFTNIQFQTFYYYTHNAVVINSNLNTVDILVWDYALDGGIENWPAIVIQSGRTDNRIRCNLNTYTAGHYYDRGRNTYIESYDNYNYLPVGGGGGNKVVMVGDQDDFLFKATDRYTVYDSPTISGLKYAFTRDQGSVAILNANTVYSITIDMTNDKMVIPIYIGLIFEGNTAKDVGIEIYYSGSWHTIYNRVNVTNYLILQSIRNITNVEQIRISIETHDNGQRLARIFAMDDYRKGRCFVEDYNGNYHGVLSFTDDPNYGIALKDANTSQYYRLGVASGVITLTPM